MRILPRSLWLPRARLPFRAGAHAAAWALSALAAAVLLLVAVGPRVLDYRVVTVLGDSMSPEFGRGDVILSVPMRPQDLRVGDVLTFSSPNEPGALVTHRVIEVVEAGEAPVVRTRGDANTAPDPWKAELSGTLWRVGGDIPWLGWLLVWLRSPVVSVIARYGAVAAFAALSLWYLWSPRGRTVPTGAVRPVDEPATA